MPRPGAVDERGEPCLQLDRVAIGGPFYGSHRSWRPVEGQPSTRGEQRAQVATGEVSHRVCMRLDAEPAQHSAHLPAAVDVGVRSGLGLEVEPERELVVRVGGRDLDIAAFERATPLAQLRPIGCAFPHP